MAAFMAESKNVMARVARLERDGDSLKRIQAQTTEVLVDMSQRMDRLSVEVRDLRDSLESRLDRLIAVTMHERTHAVERFADIERRLAKLESRLT
jgi:hypothetical protein